MNKRILIAIDLSENSLKAVDYVAGMISCHTQPEIVLLHVIREPSSDIMPDEKEREEHLRRLRISTLSVMEEAGRRLTSAGIPEKDIQLKVQVCKRPVSIAELILQERGRCGCGTIVVGRRGLTRREEFLFGSVSNSIVRDARDCTVWVVE